ncbi:MAG TPA: hypothetical protein VFS88_00145 [Micavibrio sp.]|nr:hypothetical protein [Micavibrio sp.]
MADKKDSGKSLQVSTGDSEKDSLLEDMLDSVEAKTGLTRADIALKLRELLRAASDGKIKQTTLEEVAERLGTTTEEFQEKLKRIADAQKPTLN